ERDLDRVGEVGGRAADRVVDHVDAVGDGLVDGGHEVGRRAARGRGVLGRPERLVDRDPGTRRHAADRPEPGRSAGRKPAMVATRGARGVGGVAVVVARRVELPRAGRVDPGVATHARIEVAGADQLLVAVRGRPGLTDLAPQVHAWKVLVGALRGRRVA